MSVPHSTHLKSITLSSLICRMIDAFPSYEWPSSDKCFLVFCHNHITLSLLVCQMLEAISSYDWPSSDEFLVVVHHNYITWSLVERWRWKNTLTYLHKILPWCRQNIDSILTNVLYVRCFLGEEEKATLVEPSTNEVVDGPMKGYNLLKNIYFFFRCIGSLDSS